MRNLILAVFGLVFAGAACSKDTSAPPAGGAYVALVSVTLPSPTVVVGETEHGVATAKDVTGTLLSGRPMTWRSSVPAVASVNDAGMISALAPGATMISASAEGVSGSASLTVNAPAPIPVASVSVSLSASSVVAGQSAQATATVKDAGGNTLSGRVVTWESSNNGIATVSATGSIVAVTAGTATITASSEGVNGSAALTVTAAPPVPVATVSVSLNPSSVVAGQTGQATATLKDAGGNTLSGRVVTWQSSSQGVATISSSGGISAIAAGTTTITATSEGKSGTATLTVTAASPVPVATVTVSLSASSIVAGQTGQATATLKDAGGNTLSGRVVTWQSSATGVATVSGSGGITAIAAGTTTITATSEGKTGTATLTVTAVPPVPVASVTVSPTTASVQVGSTQQYTAVTRDASGNVLTGRPITWTSNATGVATVSGSGLGTGVATGSATITATSGTASGTANITVTAPPPPPSGSAPEPGGSDVVLLQDNFDRTSLSSLLAPYVTRGTMGLVTDGRSGQAVRFLYTGASSDNLLETTFPITTDIYFRFWYRSSPGADPSCQGQNDSGFKWFMAWRPGTAPRYTMSVTNADGVPYQGRPNAGLEFTSHDQSSTNEPAQFLSNINHNIRFSTTNEGNWHKYTLHIKVGTGGYEQIWVDDTLLLDNSGMGYNHDATGISLIQFPGTMVRWFAGCDFTVDIDDLVVWHK